MGRIVILLIIGLCYVICEYRQSIKDGIVVGLIMRCLSIIGLAYLMDTMLWLITGDSFSQMVFGHRFDINQVHFLMTRVYIVICAVVILLGIILMCMGIVRRLMNHYGDMDEELYDLNNMANDLISKMAFLIAVLINLGTMNGTITIVNFVHMSIVK